MDSEAAPTLREGTIVKFLASFPSLCWFLFVLSEDIGVSEYGFLTAIAYSNLSIEFLQILHSPVAKG